MKSNCQDIMSITFHHDDDITLDFTTITDHPLRDDVTPPCPKHCRQKQIDEAKTIREAIALMTDTINYMTGTDRKIETFLIEKFISLDKVLVDEYYFENMADVIYKKLDDDALRKVAEVFLNCLPQYNVFNVHEALRISYEVLNNEYAKRAANLGNYSDSDDISLLTIEEEKIMDTTEDSTKGRKLTRKQLIPTVQDINKKIEPMKFLKRKKRFMITEEDLLIGKVNDKTLIKSPNLTSLK